MMSRLGLALLLVVFAFSVVSFSSALLFLLLYRRNLRLIAGGGGGDDEEGGRDEGETAVGMRLPSKDLIFQCLLFWRARSRVEPAIAGDAAASEEEEWDLERWRAACMGPSRELYTIKEEEEEEMPFATPCSSPAYFTPVSSPIRAAAAAAGRGRGRTGGECFVCRGV